MGVRNKQLQSLDMKNLTKILAICLVFLQNEALGAKHYWWMDDPTVFGDGPSSNLIQKPANANQAQQPPEQKYQNPPAVQQQNAWQIFSATKMLLWLIIEST